MQTELLTTFTQMMLLELNKAESKYPVFCNNLFALDNDLQLTKLRLATARTRSNAEEEGGYSFENTIQEELLEVLEAWGMKDYDACLEELAQCSAVILRAMEFVKQQSRSSI